MATDSNTVSRTLSDLNDDVLLEVCQQLLKLGPTKNRMQQPERGSLKCLSLVNRRFHALVSRPLFRNIVIGRPGQGITNGNWGLVSHCIFSISDYPDALRLVRSVKVDIYNCGDRKTAKLPLRPPPSLPTIQLVNFIWSLPNLQELAIYIPSPHDKVLRDVLSTSGRESSLAFPSIKKLVINKHMLFMVERCPNLDTLKIYEAHWFKEFKKFYEEKRPEKLRLRDAVETLKMAGKLNRLDVECDWHNDDVWALTEACPQLRYLAMVSTMPHSTYLSRITQYLGGRLPNLQGLEIADDGWTMTDPFPSNKMEINAWKERRRMEETNEERSAKIAFQYIPNLQTLWVGTGAVATRTVETDALGRARWTWEKRKNLKEEKS